MCVLQAAYICMLYATCTCYTTYAWVSGYVICANYKLYSIFLKHSDDRDWANNVGQDQTPPNAVSDLGLHF